MKQYRVGFIGAGNMATAIITNLVMKNIIIPSDIIVYDLSSEKCSLLSKIGVTVSENATELTRASDIIFLAVKPQNYTEVISEISDAVTSEKIIVSVAAGISTDFIEKNIGFPCKILRTMPNTPLLLGEGATAICKNSLVTEKDFEIVLTIFKSAGVVEHVSEELMNNIIAVNGSSPAYIYLFAKAIIDHAVKDGIDEESAKRLFAQTLIGSAKMIASSGIAIDELIKMVSSPGGTTLKALEVFEQREFTNIIDSAMTACTKRAEELSK